jgi:hypothetical protein
MIITLLMFGLTSGLPTCGVGYPQVIGGPFQNTIPLQLDYHAVTGRMAVSGRTFDDNVVSGTKFKDDQIFVALYSGSQMQRVWLTVIKVSQHGQLITFSTDGKYLAVYGSGGTGA